MPAQQHRPLRAQDPSRPRALAAIAVLGSALVSVLAACGGAPPKEPAPVATPVTSEAKIVETVGGVGLVPLGVEGFDALPPAERALAYYLVRAAIAGRDRAWNADGGTLLEVRDLLEEVLTHPRRIEAGVRDAIRAYLERVWIHAGNHDRWSGRKFVPEFTAADLRGAAIAARDDGAEIRLALGETLDAKLERLAPVIFDAGFEPAPPKPLPPGTRRAVGNVTTSRTENDRRQEAALRTQRGFLAKATAFAAPVDKEILEHLGALLAQPTPADFSAWARAWVAGGRRVDILAGPDTASAGPRGGRPGWFGVVSTTDATRERAVAALAADAMDLLADSPGHADAAAVTTVRASARTLLVDVAPGPTTSAAIDYPGFQARAGAGVRTLVMTNVVAAEATTVGRAVVAEFAPAAERDRLAAALPDARVAFLALRAVLGGARVAPTPAPVGAWPAVLEAARADLLALHHAVDPRFVASGLLPSAETAEAILPLYLVEALAGLRGASPDGVIEAIDRRAAWLVASGLVEAGGAVRETTEGRTVLRVGDAAAARAAIDRLLERVQGALAAADRRGVASAGADWVSRFGTRADPALVAEISGRSAKSMVPSRLACLMPDLIPVRDAAGNVIDARVVPATDFTVQMLRWSGKLPFEPAP